MHGKLCMSEAPFLNRAVIYELQVNSRTGPVKVRVTFHVWETRLGMFLSCCLLAQANISCFHIIAAVGRSDA